MNTQTIIRELLEARITKQTLAVDRLREASCLTSLVALDCTANELQDARKLCDTVHAAYIAAKDRLAVLKQAADNSAVRATLTCGEL